MRYYAARQVLLRNPDGAGYHWYPAAWVEAEMGIDSGDELIEWELDTESDSDTE